jgi:hypothetical protein
LNDSSAAGQIVMPTRGSSARGQAPVGIHDFADASRKVVDGGPTGPRPVACFARHDGLVRADG